MMNTKHLENDLKAENYEMTEQGIYFPKQGILAQGEYFDRINGGEWQTTHNLVVNEGLAHLLNVAMGTAANQQVIILHYLAVQQHQQQTGQQQTFHLLRLKL